MQVQISDGKNGIEIATRSEVDARWLAHGLRPGWTIRGQVDLTIAAGIAPAAHAVPARARKPRARGNGAPADETRATPPAKAPRAKRGGKAAAANARHAKAKAAKAPTERATEGEVLEKLALVTGARVEVLSARLNADAKPALKALIKAGRVVHLRGRNRAAVYGLAPAAPGNSAPGGEAVQS